MDFSPEFNTSENSQIGREFRKLLEDSEHSELSQYSYNTPQQSQATVNELSQYSINSTMDTNSTNEVRIESTP